MKIITCKVVNRQLLLLLHGGIYYVRKIFIKTWEEGKIHNLKERSISCYKNYVSYFLNYVGKAPENLTCQYVHDFLPTKKHSGIKATTLNLYNFAIRFFYRNVLHTFWDDIMVPRMILDYQLPKVLTLDEIERLLDAIDDIKCKRCFLIGVRRWVVVFLGRRLRQGGLLLHQAQDYQSVPANHQSHSYSKAISPFVFTITLAVSSPCSSF